MKNATKFTIFATFALALSACGKSEHPGSANDAEKASGKAEVTTNALAKAASPEIKLPQADKAMADDKYTEIDSGTQLAYLYYAISGMPVDYEKLAGIISGDYRNTTNAFKKEEILQSLKPKIDQQIGFYKDNRYVVIDTDFRMSHIDMASKSFPINGVPAGKSYLYFADSSSYKLGVTNGEAFSKYKAASDDQARMIEGLVEKYNANGKAKIFLYAQDADMNSGVVKFQAVKVQLKLQDGSALPDMI
ncbi:hypothetical protein OU994_30370 [Pseudoduganella sp. SL102]|uniref:hypothetical protein n=1 Tax=Pseudoduganella sp. SL102 TaxID=2995154 RepID=UPI00248B9F3A|nr:hypothetical protein [Pseudoduganella sp. SL102]WBS02498.1 hypothetical protein OU994_30370 [Pseudoduganella sp. SL102]